MRILSIESSADETGVSIVSVEGAFPDGMFTLEGNALASQIKEHNKWGGIVPSIAKREHAKYFPILLEEALTQADLLEALPTELSDADQEKLHSLLIREEGLAAALIKFLSKYSLPEINLISVTSGPGLEPALWVGVSFAKALALVTGANVIPVNHMEGHILASVFDADRDDMLADITFPAIALLISGGHTELITMSDWGQYTKIGQTRDDAVGEAFDKAARMLGLPYPGGPEIGRLAAEARKRDLPEFTPLPRPMIHSGDLDFSFSGLKTAVRYAVQAKVEAGTLSDDERAAVARDFEDAVGAVLIKKTSKAITDTGAQTLIVGGGVANSTYLRQLFNAHFLTNFPDVTVYFPQPGLSTDNSVMIALAGHARAAGALSPAGAEGIQANGNKSLA